MFFPKPPSTQAVNPESENCIEEQEETIIIGELQHANQTQTITLDMLMELEPRNPNEHTKPSESMDIFADRIKKVGFPESVKEIARTLLASASQSARELTDEEGALIVKQSVKLLVLDEMQVAKYLYRTAMQLLIAGNLLEEMQSMKGLSTAIDPENTQEDAAEA